MSGEQPPRVMGMTTEEYQTAFSAIDYANFEREFAEIEAERKREKDRLLRKHHWSTRPEYWAIAIALVALAHAIFVQWAWPIIRIRWLSKTSPFAPPDHGPERQ
ncbi:hypothetical protein F4824DRAFT_494399 [Ustulina deusta]|nr:hypothetical protein F4823DRAFT_561824 [Ustulina deusta]KAI3342603.1 hypothetical protein F4824DRAFT_494399 [Ustulina deusta]